MNENQAITASPNEECVVVGDFKGDLEARRNGTQADLSAIRTRYEQDRRELEARFADQFGKAQKRLEAIELLLAEERGAEPDLLGQSRAELKYKLPLQDFIVNSIATTGKKSKEDIRDLVEKAGYVSEGETAGRMVHTTLLNLERASRLKVEDGYYTAPQVRRLVTTTRRIAPMADEGSSANQTDEP